MKRQPWTAEEICLAIADVGNTVEEWDTLLGEPKQGSPEWEFKKVLGDLDSRLSRLAFNIARCGITSDDPLL